MPRVPSAFLLSLLLSCLVALLSADLATARDTEPAEAADPPSAEQPAEPEKAAEPKETVYDEVEVLAGTRVGETAMESSASVAIFSAEQLEERPGALELRDLFQKTPNFVDFGEGNFAPAIRGADGTGAASGGLAFIAGTRPRATVTVDGRPLSTFGFIGGPVGLWDVEQVELYRGPQTTLQGRNSMAGALVLSTKDPTFAWESGLKVGIGTENRRELAGVVSGPLVDDALAFRLSVEGTDSESFVDFLGPQGIEDVEDDEHLSLRAKLLWAPPAVPDLRLQLTYARRDTRRPQSQLADPPFGERQRRVSQTAFEIETDELILDLDYYLGSHWSLSSTTTWADILFERLDAPERGLFVLEGPQLTHETLLRIDDPDRELRGVVGVYAFGEDRKDRGFVGLPFAFAFDDETRTAAVFGEVEWEAADGVRATLGGRFESESRQRRGAAFGIVTDLDETFDAFLPKAGLAFDVADDVVLGIEVSRGFNAGGGSVSFGATDPQGNPSPDPDLGPRSFVYDSEFVWNVEAYARARFLDDRLSLRGNLFWADYEDQQRVEQLDFPGGFTDTIIVNTPESEAYGAELSLAWAAHERFDVYFDLGLLETEIEESGDARLEGNEMARSPGVSASLGFHWRPADAWDLSFDARYVDDYFSTDLNNPLARAGDYFLADAKVSWQVRPSMELYATVTNLFDSDAEQRLFSFPATAPPSLANMVEPRIGWLGLRLRY